MTMTRGRTNRDKDKVTLGTSDRIVVLGYFLTAMGALTSWGYHHSMRMAVLETKMETIERRLGPWAIEPLRNNSLVQHKNKQAATIE